MGVDRVLPALPDLERARACDADVFGIDLEQPEDAPRPLVDLALEAGQGIARRLTNIEHEEVIHAEGRELYPPGGRTHSREDSRNAKTFT
jgi:hypothetical protein